MTRTKICDRVLPDYTVGEEIFNTLSHAAGAIFGVFALITCVLVPASRGNIWGVVGGAIYGVSLVLLYTMSSVYHGLPKSTGKKVMQVFDHCTIYFLIGGTYTPIIFCAFRPCSPIWAWTLFGIVWGCAIIGTVFTAIDLKKYSALSMVCYIGMGWSIVIAAKTAMQAMSTEALLWIFLGGVAYTAGAVLYGLGVKHRYMHSMFHLFCLAGSVMHYIAIVGYIL